MPSHRYAVPTRSTACNPLADPRSQFVLAYTALPRLPTVAEGLRCGLGLQLTLPGSAQDRPVAPDILFRHAGLGPPHALVTERRDREPSIRVARSLLVHGRSLFHAQPGRRHDPSRNQENRARLGESRGFVRLAAGEGDLYVCRPRSLGPSLNLKFDSLAFRQRVEALSLEGGPMKEQLGAVLS